MEGGANLSIASTRLPDTLLPESEECGGIIRERTPFLEWDPLSPVQPPPPLRTLGAWSSSNPKGFPGHPAGEAKRGKRGGGGGPLLLLPTVHRNGTPMARSKSLPAENWPRAAPRKAAEGATKETIAASKPRAPTSGAIATLDNFIPGVSLAQAVSAQSREETSRLSRSLLLPGRERKGRKKGEKATVLFFAGGAAAVLFFFFFPRSPPPPGGKSSSPALVASAIAAALLLHRSYFAQPRKEEL